jgi:hypothetical protein
MSGSFTGELHHLKVFKIFTEFGGSHTSLRGLIDISSSSSFLLLVISHSFSTLCIQDFHFTYFIFFSRVRTQRDGDAQLGR